MSKTSKYFSEISPNLPQSQVPGEERELGGAASWRSLKLLAGVGVWRRSRLNLPGRSVVAGTWRLAGGGGECCADTLTLGGQQEGGWSLITEGQGQGAGWCPVTYVTCGHIYGHVGPWSSAPLRMKVAVVSTPGSRRLHAQEKRSSPVPMPGGFRPAHSSGSKGSLLAVVYLGQRSWAQTLGSLRTRVLRRRLRVRVLCGRGQASPLEQTSPASAQQIRTQGWKS